MSDIITIYEKPTCSTCRQVKKAFDAHGIDFNTVNYIIDPLSKTELKKMVADIDVDPKSLVRMNEAEFKALGVDGTTMNVSQIIEVLVAHPGLMQRPVLEYKGTYILGRPVEKVEQFLSTLKSR